MLLNTLRKCNHVVLTPTTSFFATCKSPAWINFILQMGLADFSPFWTSSSEELTVPRYPTSALPYFSLTITVQTPRYRLALINGSFFNKYFANFPNYLVLCGLDSTADLRTLDIW